MYELELEELKDDAQKVSWDGEVIKTDEPWYDKKLFSIGHFKVQAGEAAQASAGLMIFVGIIIGICMAIAHRKRKRIAIEVRRMSSVVRNSIRRMSGVKITETELQNEKIDPSALGANHKQRTFLKDMFNE